MDWLKRGIKVEASTTTPLNIRGIFSRYGEISDLHHCKTGVRGCAHIFIKYKDEQSAKLAVDCKVDVPGIHVSGLSDNPCFVDQDQGIYMDLPVFDTNSLGLAPIPRVFPVLSDNSSKSTSGRGKTGQYQWPTKSSSQSTDSLAQPANAYLRAPANSLQAGFLESLKSMRNAISTPTTLTSNPLYETTKTKQLISVVSPNGTFPSLSAPTVPRSPTRSSPSISKESSFRPNAQLSLYFHGETITYDLKALDSNSQSIIELLKITDSERGSWMTVGAHYRRSGNVKAAIAVIQMMIEAMTERGISEGDLKPAFLFLSGCETDLAKQAKTTRSTLEVEQHYNNARVWLQKVYGLGNVPIISQTVGVVESDPLSLSFRPKAADRNLNIHPNDNPVLSAATVARHKTIEHEIRSLQNKQQQQSELLSQTRVAKRKLEDDFDCERDLRYRLQRRLDNAQKELEMARNMEAYALDQVKREVEARRKAEDLARTLERNHRSELQRYEIQNFSEQNTQPPPDANPISQDTE